MSEEEAKKAALQADGHLSVPEGRLLYKLAKKNKGKGPVIEIGSWKGRSTIWLAFGSREGQGKKVFAVDPHVSYEEMPEGNSFEEFNGNLKKAGVKDIVKPLVKTSEAAAKNFNEKVSLVFVDGWHDYKHAKQDFDLWFPKLEEHGIIAFHDTMLVNGPKKVVKENLFNSKHFRNIGFVDSISFAEKVKQNTFSERVKNKQVLLMKGLFTIASKLNIALGMPDPIKKAGKKAIKLMQ